MGRTPCCDKNGLKKGPWTAEEDEKLIDYIKKHGYGNWRTLPKNAGLQRCGKSCRLRWTNYLRPDIKRGRFSLEEEETIIQLHSILGNKWSAIASRLPGRTDNEIKNYWNTHIRKKLLHMGIDPVTHSPRLDLLDISSILNASLYNSPHQMNISRLLGVQPSLVNPELLRIAASLMLSPSRQQQEQHENQNFTYVNIPNVQENQICNSQMMQNRYHDFNHQQALAQGQIQSSIQEIPNCTSTSLSNDPLPLMHPHEVHFPSNYSIRDPVSTQNPQLTDWQGYNNVNFGNSAQIIMNPSSENFNFTNSVLSSPTTMNSNSTYITSTSSTEDERECYSSSNILNYEVPDMLDLTSCNDDIQLIGECPFPGPWIQC